MNEIGFVEVFVSLLLVALSMLVAKFWKLPVQKDLALGSVRAFVQLVAVGYALQYIFALESTLLILAALAVMLLVGAYTAAGKIRHLKNAFWITTVSMLAGTVVTLGLMLILDVISFEARFVIPLAGMIIGNSMNSAALTAERISSTIHTQKAAIEASLALGKGWRTATLKFRKEAAVAGMLSILNFLKTVGIVALPGAMTGMILAGIDPLKAVLLQIMVGYMLVSAVTLTSIVTLELTVRRFFSPYHQLRRLGSPDGAR